MEQENMKIVDFDQYCPICKHTSKEVYEDPCYDCIGVAARQYSHKPEKFEEGSND